MGTSLGGRRGGEGKEEEGGGGREEGEGVCWLYKGEG